MPENLPAAIYSSEQVRELDRIAIEKRGIQGYELMSRAGQAALAVIKARWPGAQKLLVYCGAGNNAGDGYVLARLAAGDGFTVHVVAVVSPERLQGDAATAWRACRDAGVAIEAGSTAAEAHTAYVPDLLVDALLGIGIDRPLDGVFADVVGQINSNETPVLALDIPTGLDADTGDSLGSTVNADVTISFVGLKQGVFLGNGPDYCGALEFSDLGIPEDTAQSLTPPIRRLTLRDLRAALPRRRRTSHKAAHGRLLLVGGAPGMCGAIRLAAEAALRAGAGLVYVGTHKDSVAAVMAGRPEIMCRAIDADEDLEALIALADAAVLGPGLGDSDWAQRLWRGLMQSELPLIVDADGLNQLAQHRMRREHWVLTPHPGEAARLLETTPAEIQSDRLKSVADLAERFAACVVLKGASSLVGMQTASGDITVDLCDRGNPGMATAGTGDVLSGVIGALLVQTGDLARAVRAGVLLHALAGDDAAADGERGMIATDLMPYIRRWANPS